MEGGRQRDAARLLSSGYDRIVQRRFGGPEELRLEHEAAVPEPGIGEALVRVLAAGIGYTDTIVRRGKYPGHRRLPMTPGYDVVGVVEAVGPGSDFAPGAMVADMTVTGGYAQFLIRPAAGLVSVPPDVDIGPAVCIPLIWMTAWQMLCRYRTLPAGETVLVVGAGGGVGRALSTLAHRLGLRVIGTCSARDLSTVSALGARAIDYHCPNLLSAIREANGGAGVAMAFDAAGGESWRTSWQALGAGGLLVGYGAETFFDGSSGGLATASAFAKLMVGWNIRGRLDGTARRAVLYDILGRRKRHPQDYAVDATALFAMLATGEIAPQIQAELPLAAAADGHRRIAAGGLSGRLVLRPWNDVLAE